MHVLAESEEAPALLLLLLLLMVVECMSGRISRPMLVLAESEEGLGFDR